MKSFYKTVSWLIVSGILISACNWYEMRDLKVAVIAAFWGCVFKTPVYWFHEKLWSNKSTKIEPVNPNVVCQACEQALQSQ